MVISFKLIPYMPFFKKLFELVLSPTTLLERFFGLWIFNLNTILPPCWFLQFH